MVSAPHETQVRDSTTPALRDKDALRSTHVLFASVAFAAVPTLTDHLAKYCRVKLLPLRRPGRHRAFSGKFGLGISSALQFFRLLFSPAACNPHTLLITDSAHYPCLLIARILSLFGVRKNIYLFNFYIHQMGTRRAVRRILAWLLHGNVALMVQSSGERDYFTALSPVANVRYFPYCRGPIEAVDPDAIRTGDYVFAGGYTNRDYETLVAAARGLPDVPFIIVSSRLNHLARTLSPNIRHFQDIDLRRFHNLLAGARLVVIPLKENVGSSGQMVALAAMQFSKTVVYPGFDVVAQYFVDRVSGMEYEAGSSESLRDTIRELYSGADRLRTIGVRARKRWETEFSMARFESALVDHIKSVLENQH